MGSSILGIDTTGPHVAVALVRGDEVVWARAVPGGRRGAPLLAGLLDEALGAGPLERAPEAIAVCTGPGAFTAVRVGLAAAAGLGLATGRPTLGIPSDLALVEGAAAEVGEVVPVLDVGRGEVWVRTPGEATGRLTTPDALAASLGDRRSGLAGSGAERHRAVLERILGAGAVVSLDPRGSAVGAALLGARALAAGQDAPLRPVYARPPDAVPPRRP